MSDAIEAACRAHSPQWGGIDPEIQRYAREQMRAAITAYEAAKGGGVASIDGLPPGIRAWEYQDADGNWNLCVDSEHKLSLEREATFYGTGPVAFRPLFALASPASGERDAVIEECAKVAEAEELTGDAPSHFTQHEIDIVTATVRSTARSIAAAIRSLRMEGK